MPSTAAQKQDHILVIKLGALGDFIQALGAMKAIREHHPTAKITLMTTKPFVQIAQKCGYFNDIIIDKKPKFYQVKEWLTLRSTLLNGHYCRIYDLQNNDRTSLYFKLIPTRKKPEWVGAAKGASHENNNPERTAGHALDGHKQTLTLAGIQSVSVDTMDWIHENIDQFKLPTPFALIVSGCAPQHPQKRWAAQSYAQIATHLVSEGITPVLLGTNSESEITNQIAKECSSCINLTGKTTLFEIAALAKSAKLAIGNDTGPMHIIAATRCPSLCLFSGHSKIHRHAPKGEKVIVLQEDDINIITPETVIKNLQSFL